MAFVISAIGFGILGVVGVALAFLVFRHGLEKPLNRLLGTYLLLMGGMGIGGAIASAFTPVSAGTPYDHWAMIAGNRFQILAQVMAIAIAVAWLTKIEEQVRWYHRATPWMVAGIVLVWISGQEPASTAGGVAMGMVYLAFIAVLFLAPVALFREARKSTDAKRGTALVGISLFVIPWYVAWREITSTIGGFFDWQSVIETISTAQIILWLLTMATMAAIMVLGAIEMWPLTKTRYRQIRWLLLLISLSAMFDAFVGLARGGALPFGENLSFDWRLGPFAVWQAASLSIVAYVILSGQVPGMEQKFRMGLSKSTVAAIFIAVFFIVSEAAQEFFGQETGNQYYGIAAAGLLVLGIAPLQRLADRFAASALAVDATSRDRGDAHDTYRVLLRRVYADNTVVLQEEKALAATATALGISAEDAFTMRQELEGSR